MSEVAPDHPPILHGETLSADGSEPAVPASTAARAALAAVQAFADKATAPATLRA
jgi:hypothetical protein